MTPETMTLITMDYPPMQGGVARYLSNLVAASDGKMRVVVPSEHQEPTPAYTERAILFWRWWPRWFPAIRVCRRESFVLVSHVFPLGTAAWISRMLGGPTYALLFHGLDIRFARGAWKRWLLRRIVKKASVVCTNSASTRRDLEAVMGRSMEEVCVLTPGVEMRAVPTREEARRALGINEHERVLVSVARLVPRKGIDRVIEALSNIRERVGGCRYVVIGTGMDMERLKGHARERRVDVDWRMNCDEETKWRYLAAADVFVLPVRDEGDDVEGFGIVYLEAALCGVPAVAGRSGGAGEAVVDGETGVVVDPLNAKEIADAVVGLMRDGERRIQCGAAAKARVIRDFTWAARWEEFERIVQAAKAR